MMMEKAAGERDSLSPKTKLLCDIVRCLSLPPAVSPAKAIIHAARRFAADDAQIMVATSLPL
jgi:hypothetical protein